MNIRSNLRTSFYLLIFIFCSIWTVISQSEPTNITEGQIPVPQVGFLSPKITLADIFGSNVDSGKYLGNNVIIINYWASWCPPCRAEMPALNEIYQAYKSQGLVILGVNASFEDSSSAMEAFLEPLAISFPILLDTNGTVFKLYEIHSLPTTFFIDRKGIIRDIVIGGPLSYAGLVRRIKPLLQEQP